MARPVNSAIPLLEEAVHLLRRAPPRAILCHLLGATPFELALLLFWNDVNNPRTADATVGRDAVVLALLLVWMNCWRAVFAGRLLRCLGGGADTPWNWRRAWNLVASQALLGASKLAVLPLAATTIFGFAGSVAFYRSATVLAGRAELDPVQVIARAWKLASLDRRQSWLILPVVGFLGVIFTANLALTMALGPQLIHALTGYESQFSLSGGYYIFTPLYLWATLAISWMVFDPFIQAVYCLRVFHGESLTTGEDIRAGLRVLTSQGAALSRDLATPVTRALAWALDSAIVALGGIVISQVGRLSGAVAVASFLGIMVAYAILLEWRWDGQTAGKRLLGLRVVDAHGLRPRLSQIVLRNLLRVVDMLPFFYLVGGLSAFFSRQGQRLGDIAARTLVTRERRAEAPDLEQIAPAGYDSLLGQSQFAAHLRTVVTPQAAALAIRALTLREGYDPRARSVVFRELAAHFRSLAEFPEETAANLGDEQYVRSVLRVIYSAG